MTDRAYEYQLRRNDALAGIAYRVIALSTGALTLSIAFRQVIAGDAPARLGALRGPGLQAGPSTDRMEWPPGLSRPELTARERGFRPRAFAARHRVEYFHKLPK